MVEILLRHILCLATSSLIWLCEICAEINLGWGQFSVGRLFWPHCNFFSVD